MLRTSLLLQKLRLEVHVTQYIVITCNRVTVLALCTISAGRLSMYQVSFDSLLYFQRYAPNKFNTAKIRKGNNSINTDDRVMVLAFCTSPHTPQSLYQVSLINFNTLN